MPESWNRRLKLTGIDRSPQSFFIIVLLSFVPRNRPLGRTDPTDCGAIHYFLQSRFVGVFLDRVIQPAGPEVLVLVDSLQIAFHMESLGPNGFCANSTFPGKPRPGAPRPARTHRRNRDFAHTIRVRQAPCRAPDLIVPARRPFENARLLSLAATRGLRGANRRSGYCRH